jgi:hypothetical protein
MEGTKQEKIIIFKLNEKDILLQAGFVGPWNIRRYIRGFATPILSD